MKTKNYQSIEPTKSIVSTTVISLAQDKEKPTNPWIEPQRIEPQIKSEKVRIIQHQNLIDYVSDVD